MSMGGNVSITRREEREKNNKEKDWGRRKERKDRKSRIPLRVGSGATHDLPTAANLLCKTVFRLICLFCSVSQQCNVESVFSVKFSNTSTLRVEFQGWRFLEET